MSCYTQYSDKDNEYLSYKSYYGDLLQLGVISICTISYPHCDQKSAYCWKLPAKRKKSNKFNI